ncbi:hypothetical protein MCOL2_00705 [Listeria fleischmannii FSL S10-1203]|uniref:Uncharacterized protein n=1 Tax=Listeria fleischmannii FSL S10-1203 TaxID=1265822 RepID=W7DR33_9LIST|nr:hypothetical protein MCOL2_00705 [Listeria fleischmannii FSL S10-1203]
MTADEKIEQDILRKEYLKSFRSHVKGTILNTTILDPKGNDITPSKVKQMRKKRK